MPKHAHPVHSSAAALIPDQPTLAQVREAARSCQACDLWRTGTQMVFGVGEKGAEVMFVGEQPGDQEDRLGEPFVGPAGRLLDQALVEVGIPRQDTYVTNVVKHFKWIPKGRRRIHQSPNSQEIAACKPWLDTEIALIKPQILVCLGAVAAKALLGAGFRVSRDRGEFVASTLAPWAIATVHPSAILRIPDDDARAAAMRRFVDDLKKVADHLARLYRTQL
jgi:uracil-DNA glycosylase family protein